MAVDPYLYRMTLPAASGVTKDEVVNDFVVVEDITASGSTVFGAILDFYNTAGTGQTQPVGHYINATRDRGSGKCRADIYDLAGHLNGSPHGPPLASVGWTLTPASSGTPLPAEVAVALSFHGDLGGITEFGPGTRPRARRRGRIYIGPLNSSAMDSSTANVEPRPSSGFVTNLAAAATNLAVALSGTPTWSVWSRANAATYGVEGGWVDDAFDTIRGRGPEKTLKTFWP